MPKEADMYDPQLPIRIQIDRHGNIASPRDSLGGPQTLWIVSIGCGNHPQWAQYRSNDHDFSYHLEIDNSYPLVRENGVGRVTRAVFTHGQRWIVEDDETFESNVQATIEHEFFVPAGMDRNEAGRIWQLEDDPNKFGVRELTHDEASDLREKAGRYSVSMARILGVNIDIFDRLLDGWRAITQFADFAITI
jgi:hypothetical protein